METSLLINKLVECAKEIEGGHLNDADLLLEEIIAANESFSKPTKSLVKYYAEALVRRLYRLYPRNLTPLIPSGTDRFPETDYPFAPFFCFGDFTTLDPARDALKGKRRVHIIEFGIVVSYWRYCDLFRDITTHSTGPISFRLTFVGPILSTVADHTQKTLERLHGEAERFAIHFEGRRLVANSAADIVDSALKLTRASEDETIVVKWKFQFHKLLTLTGASEKVLSKLKEMKPEIMIIVEQDASHNGQNLLDWFSKSFQYYSIVFDSLEKDNLDFSFGGVRRKVLWEMYFRRQICKLVAPGGTDHIERHETFAHWQDRLRLFGFRHYRFKPKSFNNFCREQMPEYSWEEKDRHPVLTRKRIPLLFSSAWKPDPAQLNSGSDMELDTENYSNFHENQPDDPRIMTEEITWSEKCFSINQIAASAEIYDILEYTCNVHNLPLALTWISDRRDYIIVNSKRKLRIVESACYLNDVTMEGFVEACGKHHLEEGQGAAGKALQSNGMHFNPVVSELSVDDYPFVYHTWDFGLHAAVSFKLENIHMSRVDYVLEFFLPAETKEVSEHKLLIDGISSILQKNCRNSWVISGMESSDEVNMDSVVGSEGAIPVRSPPASLDNGSFNENGTIIASDAVNAADHGIQSGVQAHEQDVGEQNSRFEAASNGITQLSENFISQIMIEDLETNDAEPVGFSDSNFSINSSEFGKAYNIVPTAPCLDIEEVGGDSSHLNASTRKKRMRTSEVWKYFEEVRGNGEVWAICKSCSTRYRGESTNGTTNLHKHLKSCAGKK
ncbi:DELLA PROTEIN RGA2-LIKE [Salix purpurea]|uniref:DELLA PROTEIN RGA2-LIKE n=1 Tax=Salix purpurea TaxID=77065 RepID=A0A9Q0V334_SALPP|nr:DELLA PROTEIN RGA2-LIKE [Salix purpurea]